MVTLSVMTSPRSTLSQRLRYEFKTPGLLREALTHRSHSLPHNERLEFLGDSVLNCVIALQLFQRFPKLSGGELSRLRANLVNKNQLFEMATALDLGEHVLLGEGELKSGGHRRPSILADALEAILGAVFLDTGFDAAEQVIVALFGPLLDRVDPEAVLKDPKTLLQELLQSRKLSLPTYSVVEVT